MDGKRKFYKKIDESTWVETDFQEMNAFSNGPIITKRELIIIGVWLLAFVICLLFNL